MKNFLFPENNVNYRHGGVAYHRLRRDLAFGDGRFSKKNMFCVYILQSNKNNRYYIGFTSDMDSRLKHHNSGANKSTKPHRPWKIVFREFHGDKRKANQVF